MTLLTILTKRLQEHEISPNVVRDQHFCIDESVFHTLIHEAGLNKSDVVVEIGPGPGFLTREIAKMAQKVIALEIDETLRPLLDNLPENVNVIFGDALTILQQKKERLHYNKLISNLPYQICEPLLQYLITAKNVEKTVITVPKAFAQKAARHPIFSSFFELITVRDVPKESFYPKPRVQSAILAITRRRTMSDEQYILQKMYLQRDKKVRNGLKEALIDLYAQKNKILTKKQALQILDSLNIPEKTLDTLIAVLPLVEYGEITRKIGEHHK